MYVRTYAPVDFVVRAEALNVKVLLSSSLRELSSLSVM